MKSLLALTLAMMSTIAACGTDDRKPSGGVIPQGASDIDTASVVAPPAPPAPALLLSLPGTKTTWQGYDRFDFTVSGIQVMVIAPAKEAKGRPWVWFGEFFDVTIDLDTKLLANGFYLVHLNIPNMYGSPAAGKLWDAVYAELTTKYGLSLKPTLAGYSRGTLYAYRWATTNPDKVSAIYGMSSVGDFKSWPGGFGNEPRIESEWSQLLTQYGFANDAAAEAYTGNPIDSLAPLAAAGVPLLHFCGDADVTAPCPENGAKIAANYKKLGGDATLVVMPGAGHNLYAQVNTATVMAFITEHAK